MGISTPSEVNRLLAVCFSLVIGGGYEARCFGERGMGRERLFRFRVFFGACSLQNDQNEVGDAHFLSLLDKSRSLPFCVASLKKICAKELLGANVLKRESEHATNSKTFASTSKRALIQFLRSIWAKAKLCEHT